MIDFFLDNYVCFLLFLILLQAFAWLVGKIKSRLASSANPLGKREGKVGITGNKIRRALKRVIWGPENKDADKFWEEKAYGISRFFGTMGVAVLLGVALFSPPPGSSSESVRNTYYFLIFMGGVLAAILATWRGRQSERQIRQFERQMQNSRFEKGLDMITDPTSPDRRAAGFLILGQMLSAWRENFDASKENDITILAYFTTNYFKLKGNNLDTFKTLYAGSRRRCGKQEEEYSWALFTATHKPVIDSVVLRLGKGIVDWHWKKFGAPDVIGQDLTALNICALKVAPGKSGCFIFSEMDLRGINFLVVVPERGIEFPTLDAYANFTDSCFLQVEMHGATVDYVDFSESHLLGINLKGEEDSNMSCIGTKFDKANLIVCNFRGADFEDASFDDTNISGSDFSQTNLTPKQFETAYWIRPGRPQFLKKARSKFPEDDPNNFLDGFTDKFVESLARDAQDEEGMGQGEVEVEPAP